MSVFDTSLLELAGQTLRALRARGWKIVTAESCTGGLIAAVLTEIPGSSDVVERGYVTYSNEAKAECIGVPAGLIAAKGAVSAEVAQAMAQAALTASRADVSIAVTGVAGPGGGSVAKPVGLVFLAAAARNGDVMRVRELRLGDIGRSEVRLATVRSALEDVCDLVRSDSAA